MDFLSVFWIDEKYLPGCRIYSINRAFAYPQHHPGAPNRFLFYTEGGGAAHPLPTLIVHKRREARSAANVSQGESLEEVAENTDTPIEDVCDMLKAEGLLKQKIWYVVLRTF